MADGTAPMVMRSIYISPEVDSQLKRLAYTLNVSKGNVIRAFVNQGLKHAVDLLEKSPDDIDELKATFNEASISEATRREDTVRLAHVAAVLAEVEASERPHFDPDPLAATRNAAGAPVHVLTKGAMGPYDPTFGAVAGGTIVTDLSASDVIQTPASTSGGDRPGIVLANSSDQLTQYGGALYTAQIHTTFGKTLGGGTGTNKGADKRGRIVRSKKGTD